MRNKDLTTCAARGDTYNLRDDDAAINNNRCAMTLTSGFFSNGYVYADLPIYRVESLCFNTFLRNTG